MMMKLNLELDKLEKILKENNPKIVLIQLPDGLKPRAFEIKKFISENFPSLEFHFWLNSCYGACDIPNVKGYDLLVQFGHSGWC
jgi:2-(3-amino-3-carboxypropyl)histidine synthase